MSNQQLTHVLDGYKVLDFTHALAGPTATRMMAEMGAEIIKVEIPPVGDMTHSFPLMRNQRSGFYIQQNRGKKSLFIDVKTAKGLALIKKLITKVDVMVENFAPGAIGRMGLDYETVSAINPGLVMCSISAFGQSGPLASRPGYDFIAQAFAGVTHVIGEPDRPPALPGLGIGDVMTGVHGLGAIACALLYKEKTGRGQHLDISLLDSYYHCHDLNVMLYSATGGKVQPKRTGSQLGAGCPLGIFNGKNPEEYVAIACPTNRQWRQLCTAMDREDLARHPEYASNNSRIDKSEEIIALINAWIASHDNTQEALDKLDEHRVPFAPVLDIGQTVNHPHHRQRGTVRTIKDDEYGDFDVPGFPLRFSEFPEQLDLRASHRGDHNGEILADYLGMNTDEIKALEEEGILVTEATKNLARTKQAN
jgi:crotonobetainyl-CoA:carnitine CoA-transferase CaiB-like acyl-CoA transferase